MYCPDCGASQQPGSKFCLNCGTKLPIDELPQTLRQPDPLPQSAPLAPLWQVRASRGNYFLRHWRGELSLPVSYWVNGMLLGMAIGVLSRMILPSDEFVVRHPSGYGVGMIGYLVAIFGMGTWQLVGIWRAAGQPQADGKVSGWGPLAKVAVVFGTVQLAAVLFTTGIPVMRDNFHILTGDTAGGRYQLRVLRDATELEISGPITFGLTEDVRHVLDAQPTIRLVHLNSGGGRVAEARALRDLIAERGLITYTATGCSSACTIAYMAGKERWIAPDATLGFHQYSLAGVSQPEADGGYRQEESNWTREGVPVPFIKHAFSTPAAAMWSPTSRELIAAHIVTRYASGADTAISGVPMTALNNVDDELGKMPLYAALRETDPMTYAKVRDVLRDGVAKGHSSDEIRSLAFPLIQASVMGHLPTSSDQAVQDFTRVAMDEMNELYRKDPALCFDYVFNVDNGASRGAGVLSKMIKDREFAVMAAVLRTAGTARRIPESEARAEAAPVLDSLMKSYGKEVALIGDVKALSTDKARGCQLIYALYAGALNLPPSESANVLRYLYAGK